MHCGGAKCAAWICGWRWKKVTARAWRNGIHRWARASSSCWPRFPKPQRAALVLRYQEDLTPEEIAATLDAPLATVKSNLQRGLKLLRAKATSHLKEYVRVKEQPRGL